MQKIAFKDLSIKAQARYDIKPLKKKPDTIAYDTETINGRAELICNSDGEHIHPMSFDDCLHFLCRHKTRKLISFWYNLKYDFQALLKWLHPDDWKTIYTKGELIYNDWKITYIPKKMLMFRNLKLKQCWKHYDISQYYRMKLDDAGHKYFGMGKLEHGKDLSNLTLKDIKSKEIIKYCIRDAVITKRLADRWINICWDQGLQTKNFCSTASTSSRYFMSKVNIFTVNSFLKNSQGMRMLEDAWNTVSGALISTYKRGYFPSVYEYDINSAYPHAMSNFPDVRNGYFIRSKKQSDLDRAYLGWIKCRVDISDYHNGYYTPPLPILRDNKPNYYPAGNYETYLTLSEYKNYSKYFDIQFIEGTLWIPDKEITYLFKDIITKLYTKRKQTIDENENFFIKIILNSIYGKFLQKNRVVDPDKKDFGKYRTGILFNPFIASYILADTRIAIFNFMVNLNSVDIIACFTDSVITKTQLNIPNSSVLGDFAPASKGEMVIIGSGVYTIKGQKLKNRLRGFKPSDKESDNLFELLKKYYDKDEIPVQTTVNYSPLLTIIRKIPEQMNIITNYDKKIKINFDTKRLWDYYPIKAGELLEKQIDSSPLIHLN